MKNRKLKNKRYKYMITFKSDNGDHMHFVDLRNDIKYLPVDKLLEFLKKCSKRENIIITNIQFIGFKVNGQWD